MMQKIKDTATKFKSDLKTGPTFSKARIIAYVATFAIVGGSVWLLSLAAAPQSGQPISTRVNNLHGTFENWVGEKFPTNAKNSTPINNSEFYKYYLDTTDNQKYQLDFGGQHPQLLSGSTITVSGNRSGNKITVTNPSDFKINHQLLPHHSPRKVAVILFNTSANPTQTMIFNQVTPDSARTAVFGGPGSGSVNQYYQETSYNQRSLMGNTNPAGDVYGWYTVNDSSNNCPESNGDISLANSAAANDGFNPDNYDNVIYAWPASSCGYSGFALIGGKYSYINGDFSISTIGHELGHNFGLDHANELYCIDTNNLQVPVSNNCHSLEYQDPYDIMSDCCAYQMNVLHKETLGWLGASDMQTVTSSGTYTITPMEYPVGYGVKDLVVQPASKGKTVPTPYHIEFRQSSGYFDNAFTSDDVTTGVFILEPAGLRTEAIDAEPSANSNFHITLQAGKTFYDSANNLSITTLSTSSTGATIKVTYGTQPVNNSSCLLTNAPIVVKPGSGFTGSFTLKNTGTATWNASDYYLGSINQEYGYPYYGYSVVPVNTWGVSNLKLAGNISPGGAASFSSTLMAPGAQGSYQYTWLMYQQSQGQWFGAACSATVTVNNDTTPPSAPTNLTAIATTGGANLSWGASTDNVAVVGYKIYRKVGGKGSFSLAGYSYSTSFSDTGLSNKTNYSYYVTAYDAPENESSPSNMVTVRPL